MAAFYPGCMRLILRGPGKSLVDQPDSNGYTPLHYAALNCTEPCESSVVAILKADCRLPNKYPGVFLCLCRTCRGEILRHIKNRRERLKRYALVRLPSAEAAALGLYNAAVLDSKASLVIQALERRGFDIPSPLRLDTCLIPDHQFDQYQSVSMFHQSPLNSPFGNLEAIFRFGFRDFDLPLETSALLSWFKSSEHIDLRYHDDWKINNHRACNWLIQHGANLWDPIPRDIYAATTAHYMYDWLRVFETDTAEMTEATRSSFHQWTKLLSTHDVRDDCHCRCSPGGCSPFVWFLRSHIIMISFDWYDPSDHKQELIDSFPDFLDQWKPNFTMEQLRSAVRYLTFEVLDIRHTCSHRYHGNVTKLAPDEIEELMSEDSSLTDLLEELVEDFDLKLQSSITEKDPFGLRFWNGHWRQRMEEVTTDLEEDRMGEDELLATQQLGVTWHELEESPEDYQIPRRAAPYRESDWSVEVDEERMWRTLRSLEDWRSRLDLIMSRAIPDWR